MRRESYIFSGVFHIAVALLSIFGLPFFWREPPIDDQPIVVDIVPLGEKTNPPPAQSEQAQPEPAKPEPPKPEAKPEPPKPAPPPPAPPPPAPPKPEPVPLPSPKPELKPEPKPEPKPEAKPKVKPQDELESLLKSVDKIKPKPKDQLDQLLKSADTVKSTEQGKQTQQQSVKGSTSNNPLEPVSMTEIDMIRAQIYKCWNIPAGAKDARDLVVPIRVRLQPDGTVIGADIVDSLRYSTDSFYRAAADSARRAVLLCSPLKAPPSKYDSWKEMTLRFNPKDMLGQ